MTSEKEIEPKPNLFHEVMKMLNWSFDCCLDEENCYSVECFRSVAAAAGGIEIEADAGS